MKGIIVAREKCGCVTSAWLDDFPNNLEPIQSFLESIKDWLEKGYIISLEDRKSVYAEKCQLHSGGSNE